MNDELPTGERLGRIERGVQRRIDARRQLARRVAGGAVVLLVVAGGVALIRPLSGTLTSSGASGSSAREPEYGPAASAAGAPVRCHGEVDRTVTADPAGLPASALAACARVERGASTSALEGGGATPTPSPSPAAALCRSKDGSLHVYSGPASACAAHGMTPWSE
jgi:hypothetical protein